MELFLVLLLSTQLQTSLVCPYLVVPEFWSSFYDFLSNIMGFLIKGGGEN
jgi:hypothetical protein